MRYRLRTLLIVLALGPAFVAGEYLAITDPNWVKFAWPIIVAALAVALGIFAAGKAGTS